jgi:hypothetical protein
VHSFLQNYDWATFWAIFFTNSSGHPVSKLHLAKSMVKNIGLGDLQVRELSGVGVLFYLSILFAK